MSTRSHLVEQYKNASNLNTRIQLHERFSTNPYPWIKWVFDQFDLPAPCRILDVGCGAGTLWKHNLHRIPPACSLILSDFSFGMVDNAGAVPAPLPCPMQGVVCDAQMVPFAEASFDAVVANHMLYHVTDVSATLQGLHRVLKPGGKLYASTNGLGHLRELGEALPSDVPHKPISQVIGAFTLENGGALLRQWFSDVEFRRREDGLLVTEAAPLVDYALSRISVFTSGVPRGSVDREAVIEHVSGLIASQGGRLRITKDSGLFIASKPVKEPPY